MNTPPLLLAIDQGTTSTRAILFSARGEIVAVRQKELPLSCPQKGWVEQDAQTIWDDTLSLCRAVLADAPPVAAIGITNQRETSILWDRKTGKPVCPAIVWQDRRTADLCARLKKEGHEASVAARTGLLIDPYFSATKIAWMLDHVDGARARAEAGDLAFGTVDCWLLWNLTGGAVHATDATNAARTMLFDITRQCWDEELLRLFGIPAAILPAVMDNVAAFGVAGAALLGQDIPIGGMAGDQQAALIGQACFEPGMIKATYGTGCFALMTIGGDFRQSRHRLLTTPAFRLDGVTTYALEGSIFAAGTAVQWLRDNLGLFGDAAQSEAIAESVPDSNGVSFVPAFAGLGAPYWDPHARAAIFGLTRESTAAHIVRAALEAQAFQTLDLLEAMRADSGRDPAILRADGGMTANGFVCRFLASMLDKPVEIPEVMETTALGAAALAGLYAGLYKGTDDICANWRRARRYDPSMDAGERAGHYRRWKDSVSRLLS